MTALVGISGYIRVDSGSGRGGAGDDASKCRGRRLEFAEPDSPLACQSQPRAAWLSDSFVASSFHRRVTVSLVNFCLCFRHLAVFITTPSRSLSDRRLPNAHSPGGSCLLLAVQGRMLSASVTQSHVGEFPECCRWPFRGACLIAKASQLALPMPQMSPDKGCHRAGIVSL